jgi:hypothetical protein
VLNGNNRRDWLFLLLQVLIHGNDHTEIDHCGRVPHVFAIMEAEFFDRQLWVGAY